MGSGLVLEVQKQILLNLLSNAVKFTPEGGSITVASRAIDAMVEFSVTDTGIGIAPEEQARIFLEFEQAEGGLNRKFGGTGLGLAISRRIVEGMGGNIEIESTPDQGSTFRVSILLDAKGGAPAVPPPDLREKSVLIVAPNTIEADLTTRRLTRWGADVTIADETSAVEMLAARRFDLMVVDHVPGSATAFDALLAGAPAQRYRWPIRVTRPRRTR